MTTKNTTFAIRTNRKTYMNLTKNNNNIMYKLKI